MRAIGSEQDQVDKLVNKQLHFTKFFIAVTILLGILSPFGIMAFSGMGVYDLTIQSLFWSIHINLYRSNWEFFPLYASYLFLPYVVLRIAPAYMLYRYYHEKATRKNAVLGVIIGDFVFLIGSIPYDVLAFVLALPIPIFPSPFQMLFGLLILWRYPIPEAIRIWDTKFWWENEPIDLSKNRLQIMMKTS